MNGPTHGPGCNCDICAAKRGGKVEPTMDIVCSACYGPLGATYHRDLTGRAMCGACLPNAPSPEAKAALEEVVAAAHLMLKERGDGATSRQMQDAPRDAVFVWCRGELSYPKQLARRLGREDLKIVGPSWLEEGWRGQRLSGLIVDHAAVLSDKQHDLLERAGLHCFPMK